MRSDVNCPANPPGYDVVYAYDGGHSASNRSRGQMTGVARAVSGVVVYNKALTYNSVGLLAGETVSMAGAPQVYTTQYGYDSYLRPISTTYPDGEVVSQGYNSMGLAANLASSQAGSLVDGTAASGGVSSGVSYDEAGRLRNMRLPAGGNLWVSHAYYPWTGSNGNSNGRYGACTLGRAMAPLIDWPPGMATTVLAMSPATPTPKAG